MGCESGEYPNEDRCDYREMIRQHNNLVRRGEQVRRREERRIRRETREVREASSTEMLDRHLNDIDFHIRRIDNITDQPLGNAVHLRGRRDMTWGSTHGTYRSISENIDLTSPPSNIRNRSPSPPPSENDNTELPLLNRLRLFLQRRRNERKNVTANSDDNAASPPNSKITYRCPICLEYVNNRSPATTKCGHVFCYDCITEVLCVTSSRCPLCSKKVKIRDLRLIYL